MSQAAMPKMKAKILNELKIKKMNVIGKIVEIKEKQTFTSAAGKEWEKINFVVKTNEEYNNTYFFKKGKANKKGQNSNMQLRKASTESFLKHSYQKHVKNESRLIIKYLALNQTL